MCILIVKPAGAKMPSLTTLRACHQANPDGMGFATKSRSFKTLKFSEFVEQLGKVPENEACIIHFRFATQGSVNLDNCHPFFSGADGGVFFAHNGCLPYYPKNDITDSEYVFKTVFVPYIKRYGFGSKALAEAVQTIIGGSKFAFLHVPTGNVRMFGNFENYNGCYYSNFRWMAYVRKKLVWL